MKKRVHLLSADSNNKYGMEYFVSKAFKSLGWDVLETDYRVMGRYEVSNRIKYITDVDFLLCIKGERVCPEDVFLCRVPKVLWIQDSVEANKEANFVIQTKAPLFDIVYGFAKAELPFYKQFNKKSYWLPLAACVDTHGEVNIEKTIDVGFIGNLNNNRINMINYLLDKGIPIQYSYNKDKYAEIISRTKINLNIGITDSGYQQRIYEILCAGGFLLTNAVRDENIFEDRKHLVYYKNFDDLVNLCYYYNNHMDEAKTIANMGQQEVLEKHTYIHRAQQILEDIKNARRT